MNNTLNFEVTPSQYEKFWFRLPRRTRLLINMIATHKVNFLILDEDEMDDYAKGSGTTHEFTEAWSGKSRLEKAKTLDAGKWYFIVEGHSEKSRGTILVTI